MSSNPARLQLEKPRAPHLRLIKSICLCALLFLITGCTALPVAELESDIDANIGTDIVLEIDFVEGAPKDRFIIKNRGSCLLSDLVFELDLAQSAGQLIFDTTATGAGVEVFQPFEVVAGDIVQLEEGVTDGDAQLALRIVNLGPNESAIFTIDVDDTLPAGELGQIRVADSEISGGLVSITVENVEPATARFGNNSTALVTLPACPSAS